MGIANFLYALLHGQPEPLPQRIQTLLQRFETGDLAAEQTLREVATMWESLYDEAFALALLEAVEQTGSEKAIPYVEQMAAVSARTNAQKRVQRAATETLQSLTQRKQSK